MGYDPVTNKIITDFSKYQVSIKNGHISVGRFMNPRLTDWYELPLMEITDEKDRNGNAIFEGAILKGNFGTTISMGKTHKEKEFFLEVFFDGEKFNTDYRKFHKSTHPYRVWPNFDDCEIVGSIYQKHLIPGLPSLNDM